MQSRYRHRQIADGCLPFWPVFRVKGTGKVGVEAVVTVVVGEDYAIVLSQIPTCDALGMRPTVIFGWKGNSANSKIARCLAKSEYLLHSLVVIEEPMHKA